MNEARQLKIVIAPDSFKETNSSARVALAIERGVRTVIPGAEIVRVPIADGGEGTVEAVTEAGGGVLREISVTGPLGEITAASYGLLPDNRGVIEMASASGLPLVPEDRRNPELTTSRGTGDLIRDALEQGCEELLIGVGGSATNDGGVGMASALGYRFLGSSGDEIEPRGGSLHLLRRIDASEADPRLAKTKISVACDVTNPLLGSEGASAVYGPQKGADPAMVERLEAGLANLNRRLKADLGSDVAHVPGAGAAGGLGAGLMAFCGARLRSGIEAILDIVRFDEQIRGADLILTGEGAIDGSTTYGKVPVGIARRAHNVPVIAVVGNIGRGAEAVHTHGIRAIMSTANGVMAIQEAMERSAELLEDAAKRLMRIIEVGMSLQPRNR